MVRRLNILATALILSACLVAVSLQAGLRCLPVAVAQNSFEAFKREMMPSIDQRIVVTGTLESAKLGWLVAFKSHGVYLYGTKSSAIKKMNSLNRFHRHTVEVTGTLRYFPEPRPVASNAIQAVPPEHFYFDVAEVKVVSLGRPRSNSGKGTGKTLKPNVPANWKKVNAGDFSLYLPRDMKDQKVRGIDSAVWEYRNQNLRLLIDYGMYSNDLKSLASKPEHVSESILIDGQKANLVTCRYEKLYISAVHFPKLWGSSSKLTFYVESKSAAGQRIARQIFQSIRFRT